MGSAHQDVLFFVFIGFFILIGLTSLAVLLGFVKNADRKFRQAAVPGFVGAVTTAVIGLFKIAITPAVVPIVVTLLPPPGVALPALKSGKYQYDEVAADNVRVVTKEGAVVPVLGEGNWQVQLSGEVANKPMHLHLQDEDGNWWQAGPFFPNYIRQEIRSGKAMTPISDASWHVPGVTLVSAAGPPGVLTAQQQAELKFNNYARRIDDRYGRAFYEWRVFVDEPQKVLDTIAQVDYVLHPTFPNPFQSSRDRGRKFELVTTGWGGFNILITVHYVDGREAKATYFLDLNKGWPAEIQKTTSSSMQLKLEKIQVNADGSVGSTGWLFDVLVDGKRMLHLANRSYDDGRESTKKPSSYGPDSGSWIIGPLNLGRGQTIRIDVKGERSFGHDTATGTATLRANGGPFAVDVANTKDRKKGSFTFYFAPASM